MTSYLQTAGWALIHFVWQGAAIAGAASALLRLTRRRGASTRYVIACVSLAAMLAAPVVTARLMWTAAPSPIDRASAILIGQDTAQTVQPSLASKTVDPRRDSLSPSGEGGSLAIERFLPGVTVAWLAGVLLLLARMAGGWWRVRRLHHDALSTASSRWQSACRRLAYRLGLPAAAHVVESSLVDVPTVVGWLRPAILLPIAALASLTPDQVEAILAHELAHIRRHDYAVNVLQTLAETLLFYHPAVWWVSKRIRVEREHCCDDIAIGICGDPVGYAQALAELESWRTSTATMNRARRAGRSRSR
jgi:beta-lactamase regulating signal transducer with metallopeptidase domain